MVWQRSVLFDQLYCLLARCVPLRHKIPKKPSPFKIRACFDCCYVCVRPSVGSINTFRFGISFHIQSTLHPTTTPLGRHSTMCKPLYMDAFLWYITDTERFDLLWYLQHITWHRRFQHAPQSCGLTNTTAAQPLHCLLCLHRPFYWKYVWCVFLPYIHLLNTTVPSQALYVYTLATVRTFNAENNVVCLLRQIWYSDNGNGRAYTENNHHKPEFCTWIYSPVPIESTQWITITCDVSFIKPFAVTKKNRAEHKPLSQRSIVVDVQLNY